MNVPSWLKRLLGGRLYRPTAHLCSLAVDWRVDAHKNPVGVLVIDGRDLSAYLPRSCPGRALTFPLTPDWVGRADYVDSLLLRRRAMFGIDQYGRTRRELLICHCGAIDCGCVSVEISIRWGQVCWHRFAYHESSKMSMLNMGVLYFDLATYSARLRDAAEASLKGAMY